MFCEPLEMAERLRKEGIRRQEGRFKVTRGKDDNTESSCHKEEGEVMRYI